MNKYTLPLSVTLACLLFFSGCPNHLSFDEKTETEAPEGMGYFSLHIDGVESSRTIMPDMPDKDVLFYKLEFTKSGTTPQSTGPVNHTQVSTPILLDVGTWNLTVSAYIDAPGTKMIAQAQVTGIVITSGQTTAKTVQLEPIATGSGKGTFSWNIDYPTGVSAASMTIEKTSGGTVGTYNFTGATPPASTNSSTSLDSGYYYVTFNLTMDAKTIERAEVLHVYQNLTSSYTRTFTEENFFAVMTGITVDPSSKSTYTLGEQLALVIRAVYSDNTSSVILDAFTTTYNANTVGSQTITITHTSTGYFTTFTVTVKGVARIGEKQYPTLYEAINDSTIPNTLTEIVILQDITMPEGTRTSGYTIPANKNIKLTVELNQSRTITLSAGNTGNTRVFTVGATNTPSSLTLEGNGTGILTLDGNNEAAQSIRQGVYVNNITSSFTMNKGSKITGFMCSSNYGGGVCVTSGTFTMNGGEISGNTVTGTSGSNGNGGGVYVGNGTFTMSGGEISGNAATDSGGGVYVGSGTFTMESGTIQGNTATGSGGGVYIYSNSNAIFEMKGGTIYGLNAPTGFASNTATGTPYSAAIFVAASATAKFAGAYGGGIYVANDTITTTDNTLPGTPQPAARVIGIKDYPTLNAALTDSSLSSGSLTVPTEIVILRNITVPEAGTNMTGGYTIPAKHIKLTVETNQNRTITASAGNFRLFSVSNANSSLTLEGNGTGTLTLNGGNAEAASNRTGVYMDLLGGNNRSFTMNKGVKITGFTSSSPYGSGVYVSNGTFTMNGGEISGNLCSTTTTGATAVYISSGIFTMNGGEISGNTGYTGGVYVAGSTTIFNMSGNAKIIHNTGGSFGGGGVYLQGTFNMSGGEISDNTTTGSGGGVYVAGIGTFTMSGSAKIIKNTAGSYGGGVNVTSISGNNASFIMNGGEISDNTAGNSGGGVYMTQSGTTTFTMSGGTIYGTDNAALTNKVTGSATLKGVAFYNNSGTANYAAPYGTGAITTTDNTLPPHVETFTSIANMATWLGSKSDNSLATPYLIALNVSNLGDPASPGSAAQALTDNSNIYVNLDLSNSTFTSIGEWAFAGCNNLTGVTIPNSVTSIGVYAFRSTGLTGVTIPNSVTSIDNGAFAYCSKLTAINVDADNSAYTAENGILYDKSKNTLIQYPAGKTGNTFTIPSSVTSIGEHAFAGCYNLTGVTIPNSVTSIGEHAFAGCNNLTSVTIPNSITSIGDSVFEQCSSLISVTIPNGIISIGNDTFANCYNLTSVTIPNSVTSIGSGAFYNTNLTSVTIPNGVTSIEVGTFVDCGNLTSVTIPNSVTSIEYGAFSGCYNLTSVTIPNSVTSIGVYAFRSTGLTSVTIPNSVTSIGDSAFEYSSLTSVTIGNSVTSIGRDAFYFCLNLTNVKFERAGTIIDSDAFIDAANTTSLQTAYTAGGIGTYTRPDTSSTTWTRQP